MKKILIVLALASNLYAQTVITNTVYVTNTVVYNQPAPTTIVYQPATPIVIYQSVPPPVLYVRPFGPYQYYYGPSIRFGFIRHHH